MGENSCFQLCRPYKRGFGRSNYDGCYDSVVTVLSHLCWVMMLWQKFDDSTICDHSGWQKQAKMVKNSCFQLYRRCTCTYRTRDLRCTGRARYVNGVSRGDEARGAIREAWFAVKISKIHFLGSSEGTDAPEWHLNDCSTWSCERIPMIPTPFSHWFFSLSDELSTVPKKWLTKNRACRVLWCWILANPIQYWRLNAVYRAF